jgi:hypothetical protein
MFRQGLQLRIAGLADFKSEYQKLLKKTICITFPGHNIHCHLCVTSFIFIPPDKSNFFSPYPTPLYPHTNEFNQMVIYKYATLELYGRTNFPAPFFSVLLDTLQQKCLRS